MAKELKDEELEQVVGGSHVNPGLIYLFAGRDMQFSQGWFGWSGKFPVHINSVNGTIVNMTFTDPNNLPYEKVQNTDIIRNGWYDTWTYFGNDTWEWDYNDGTSTWLEE